MNHKTPGVYIVEKNAFPNSVVEVATAIPVFIGYTQKAEYSGQSLVKKPVRINSLKDYDSYFGGPDSQQFTLVIETETATVTLARYTIDMNTLRIASTNTSRNQHYLYDSLRLFYQNGGGSCYIISVGSYDASPGIMDFTDAIESLSFEQEPTMILCPDALGLPSDDYALVMKAMLTQCHKDQNRIAILDVYDGYSTDNDVSIINGSLEKFRDAVGSDFLNYGTAYFPWLKTNVNSAHDIDFTYLSNLELIPNLDVTLVCSAKAYTNGTFPPITQGTPPLTEVDIHKRKDSEKLRIHNALLATSVVYKQVTQAIADYLNILPPGPAIAGVYTRVDTSRGVWKAPANVSLNSVIAPTVTLNDTIQNGMNVHAETGKSINAIRPFTGQGILVWGARTLDGNSQDWRYVNVRRTIIMIEQSIKLATRAYVFEPNDANTWVSLTSMIQSFLYNLWKQGALAGVVPEDAYNVVIGLGSTMTADDILNGHLTVSVQVAIVRPAEFIVITFQQLMQKS